MKIKLMNCTAPKNKINKSGFLNNLVEYDIFFKEQKGQFEVIVELQSYDSVQTPIYFSQFNYASLGDRYYFIVKNDRDGKVNRLTLREDVLFTYKDDILNSVCHIERSSKGSQYIPDGMTKKTNKTRLQFKKIGKLCNSGNTYVMTKGGL